MPVALSERGVRIMDSLPDYYWTDPATVAEVAAGAAELDRIEDMLNAIRDGVFPQRADDSYNMLPIRESLLGLPVQPLGVPLASRQNKVMGFQRRSVAKTRSWVETITAALGTADWSWVRDAGKSVTITIPVGGATYDTAAVSALARAITPTHIQVLVATGAGFVLGESALGVQPL